MGDPQDDFAVWRPPSLISFDEYYTMRKSSKDSPSSSAKDDEQLLEKRFTHSLHSSAKNLSFRRRDRRKSLQHFTSMDETAHSAARPPPPRPSPRTTPNQRLRKKSVKQHSFAMQELIDLLESPTQSPAVVHSRKYRVSNENV